ncbi:MAG: hypothetical protein DDT23_00931 [candidate division WS2 bacterium]|nr:hypothetical protein [Candidatus Lithacetigena glycinireducens]
MNRERGKHAERQVARLLGARRTKISGVSAPDIEGSWFVAEVKSYKQAPEIPLRELITLRQITGPERLRLFIYRRPHWREWVVCCLLSEFQEWYGKLPVKEA